LPKISSQNWKSQMYRNTQNWIFFLRDKFRRKAPNKRRKLEVTEEEAQNCRSNMIIKACSCQSEGDSREKLILTNKMNTEKETHRRRCPCTKLKVNEDYLLRHDFLQLKLQLFQHAYSYNIIFNLVFIIIKA